MGISAAIAATTIGTVGSVVQQRKQTEIAEEQNKLQRRAAEAQNIRARQRAARKAQIQRAQVENVATQTGVAGSSAVQGALGASETQLQSNFAFQRQLQDIDKRRASLQEDAFSAQRAGQLFGLAQQLGFQGIQTLGGGQSGGNE
jgi:hypothetical protein